MSNCDPATPSGALAGAATPAIAAASAPDCGSAAATVKKKLPNGTTWTLRCPAGGHGDVVK